MEKRKQISHGRHDLMSDHTRKALIYVANLSKVYYDTKFQQITLNGASVVSALPVTS